MKSRLLLTALATIGLFIIDATTANGGDDYTWMATPANANWNDAANWDGGATWPGDAAGDTATVPETTTDPTLNVDLTAASGNDPLAGLYIEAGAEVLIGTNDMEITGAGGLQIDGALRDLAPGKLRLSGAGGEVFLQGGGRYRIDGEITVETATSRLVFESNDAILVGNGKIIGTLDAAEIQLNAVTLTSQITIEGQLVIGLITAAGTFVNDGFVEATVAGGTIDLTDNTYTLGTGEYKVATGTAILKFGSGTATTLTSDFVVENGTLDIDIDLITAGHLMFRGGVITVSDGETAIFN